MKIKGKAFPSFGNVRIHPKYVRDYTGRPPSIEKSKRHMRQRARRVLDSKDVEVISVGDKVIRLVLDEPDPEYSALHLICAGIKMSEETFVEWKYCMLTILEKYEERAKEPEPDATPISGDQGHSRLGRLLRALVPRALRKGHEGPAKEDQHQRVGYEHGERKASKGPDTPGRHRQGA